jgi:hypothetical protein
MGKPPVRILACDRRERFGDGLLPGLQRACRLHPHERLDRGPTRRDRGDIRCIRREREPPDPRSSPSRRHPRALMGCAVLHEQARARPRRREPPRGQNGQPDRASGAACDRQGRAQPLATPGAAPGDMAAPLDGLRRLRALAPRRTGGEAGPRLRAARSLEHEAVIRSQRRDGVLQRGPWPVPFWPLVRGGVQGCFDAAGPEWCMAGGAWRHAP